MAYAGVLRARNRLAHEVGDDVIASCDRTAHMAHCALEPSHEGVEALLEHGC